MAYRKAGDDVVFLEPGELSEATGTESESGPRLFTGCNSGANNRTG